MTIEQLTQLFLSGILPQQISQGSVEGIVAFVDRIDTDKQTIREAVLQTIRELNMPPAGEGQAPGGAGGAGGPQDIVKMLRSFASGGIPGQAEGLPQGPGPGVALPSPVRRQLSETAPGGTAA
ncbi:MAG TPA: hypothetical protein ENG98_04295 [Actinobacteria bacterium]|nr:hypothetical protein [Actinomycetota bacterium]